ncbi:MAG: rhomboid family intramembrane serine protease [Pirellulaceae bacterium]|nr:MAG: rhomboid family intramembrane serine protease [Pirellulaceae bacterium]
MRQIGVLADESTAHRFVRYLESQGIDALAEQDQAGWAVWVRDEDHRQKAQEELSQFLLEPDHPRYRQAPAAAEQPRTTAKCWSWPVRKKRSYVGSRARVPLTRFVIAITLAVTLGGWFGKFPPNSLGDALYRELRFASPMINTANSGRDAFASIRQGELWRLLTPMFLHFDYVHIIFSVVMFYYVASQVERLQGAFRLGLLIVLTSLAANVAQAYFKGPDFGGLSGVVYGLLGYIWIKSLIDPESGYQLEQFTWLVAVIWFFLCAFDIIPNVANHAHAGGLVMGILAGLAGRSRRAEP